MSRSVNSIIRCGEESIRENAGDEEKVKLADPKLAAAVVQMTRVDAKILGGATHDLDLPWSEMLN